MESGLSNTVRLNASDYRYQYLFENATDAVLIFEPYSEIILDANQMACMMYGYERSELVGLCLKHMTKNVEQGEAEIQKLLQQLTVKNYETKHYHKDGTIIDLLINSSLIEFDGRAAILSINRDVIARKKTEEALHKSEASLRTIFENTDIGHILMSDTLHIRSFNRPASLFIHRKHNQILKKNDLLFEYFPAERIAGLKLMVLSVLDGKTMDYERNLFFNNKEEFWYAVKYPNFRRKSCWVPTIILSIPGIIPSPFFAIYGIPSPVGKFGKAKSETKPKTVVIIG